MSHSDPPLLPLSLPSAIPVTPAGPGLPGHHSIRPYTVFELEQVRQHSRKYAMGQHMGHMGLGPGLWMGKAGDRDDSGGPGGT